MQTQISPLLSTLGSHRIWNKVWGCSSYLENNGTGSGSQPLFYFWHPSLDLRYLSIAFVKWVACNFKNELIDYSVISSPAWEYGNRLGRHKLEPVLICWSLNISLISSYLQECFKRFGGTPVCPGILGENSWSSISTVKTMVYNVVLLAAGTLYPKSKPLLCRGQSFLEGQDKTSQEISSIANLLL